MYENAYDLFGGKSPSVYGNTVWFDPDSGNVIIGLDPAYSTSWVFGSEKSHLIFSDREEQKSWLNSYDKCFENDMYLS